MSNSSPQQKVTFWHMLRDIFVTAINRGQLPTAILGLILVIIFARVPTDVLTGTLNNIIANLVNFYLVGYGLFVLSMIGWWYHAKRMRTLAFKEQKRIGDEKTKLQRRSGLGSKVKSSKQK